MICYYLYHILYWLLLFIFILVYFTTYASCLLSVFVLCLFFVPLYIFWSRTFTAVPLIIGRQLVEIFVFLATCDCMICVCNLTWKYGKINWWLIQTIIYLYLLVVEIDEKSNLNGRFRCDLIMIRDSGLLFGLPCICRWRKADICACSVTQSRCLSRWTV